MVRKRNGMSTLSAPMPASTATSSSEAESGAPLVSILPCLVFGGALTERAGVGYKEGRRARGDALGKAQAG